MSSAGQYAAISTSTVILIMGLHFLQVRLDEQRAPITQFQRFMYLPQGEHLKIAALGYQHVVADLLWIQVIQAMGERKVTEEAGRWIYRALDIITTMDPKFVRVYEVGGIALTTLVVHIDESNRILEQGLKEVVVERDLKLLEEAISRYRKRYNRAPERLEDLVTSGLLRSLPREPFGGRYLYDPQTQTVRSSEMKERLKVYGKRRPR